MKLTKHGRLEKLSSTFYQGSVAGRLNNKGKFYHGCNSLHQTRNIHISPRCDVAVLHYGRMQSDSIKAQHGSGVCRGGVRLYFRPHTREAGDALRAAGGRGQGGRPALSIGECRTAAAKPPSSACSADCLTRTGGRHLPRFRYHQGERFHQAPGRLHDPALQFL